MNTSTRKTLPAATKKAAAKKATTKKPAAIGSKPTAEQIAAAKAASAAAVKMVEAFALEAGTPFKQLQADRAAFSAYTLACLQAAGMADKVADKAAATIGKNPSLSLLRGLIGGTAFTHWKSKGRINADGLTVAGLNEISARLGGTSKGYNTDHETVALFVPAIAKGGKVELRGRVYSFASSVKAKA